jgi:hypothetical protein
MVARMNLVKSLENHGKIKKYKLNFVGFLVNRPTFSRKVV